MINFNYWYCTHLLTTAVLLLAIKKELEVISAPSKSKSKARGRSNKSLNLPDTITMLKTKSQICGITCMMEPYFEGGSYYRPTNKCSCFLLEKSSSYARQIPFVSEPVVSPYKKCNLLCKLVNELGHKYDKSVYDSKQNQCKCVKHVATDNPITIPFTEVYIPKLKDDVL